MATLRTQAMRAYLGGVLGVLLLSSPVAGAAGAPTVVFQRGVDVTGSASRSAKAKLALLVDPATQRKRLLVVSETGPKGAADIVVRTSSDDGQTWSAPVNLSSVAGRSTVLGTPAGAAFPMIGSGRTALLVLWTSTYCPGGAQKSDAQGAFTCVWVSRSMDTATSWSPAEQLTDGSREAMNVVTFLTDAGAAIAWQEDPAGKQPCGGDDEGEVCEGEDGEEGEEGEECASGAHTAPGTDIYYTALPASALATGTPFPAATQVSDNIGEVKGEPAASRPQLRLIGSTAMLAYEETKPYAEGKNIIWHSFPFAAPPVSAAGDILNDTSENARRVRMVAQGSAQVGTSGTTAIVFWRQGADQKCGPADILLRRATGGYGAANFGPPVNLSGVSLDEPTWEDPFDSAKAHRAILRGDLIAFVYTHTPSADDAARQLENYNVFIRMSRNGGQTWGTASNLSEITDTRVTAWEPRLEATPGSIPTGLPEDRQNPDAFFVAWGVQSNEAKPVRMDILLRVTTDQGASFGNRVVVAGGPSAQSDVQFKATPDGSVVHAVWNDTEPGVGKTYFASSKPTLTVQKAGDGDGRVLARGLDCGSDCDSPLMLGSTTIITVLPSTGSVFAGWSGDDDCLDGIVSMTGGRECVATFTTTVAPEGQPPAPQTDMNGDGIGDVVTYVPASGAISIRVGDPSGGSTAREFQWSAGWTLRTADFNGDRFSDLFLYDDISGRWVKAINDRNGGFSYITGTWTPGWTVYVTDLDGDRLSDVFLYRAADGAWFKCYTTENGGFRYSPGGFWITGWSIYPAALNDDGLGDLFLYNESTGVGYWAVNDGRDGWWYSPEVWRPGWQVIPGDFNGDGLSDLLLYSPVTGEWALGTNHSGRFEFESGTWRPGWTVTAGDLTGDGVSDLFLYNQDTGYWVEAIRAGGSSFAFVDGMWTTGWEVHVEGLNGDTQADVLLHNRTNGIWYYAISGAPGVFSYATGVWDPGTSVVSRGPH